MEEEIQTKKQGAIVSVVPTEKSFETNVKPIEPSLVNFFFGRNGAGKSTIAQTIKDKHVTWEGTKGASDFDLKVYDQKYIEENFKDYQGLTGRLIFHKANDEAIKKQEDIKKQQDILSAEIQTAKQGLIDADDILKKEIEDHKGIFWKLTDYPRKTFKKMLSGCLKGADAFYEGFVLTQMTAPVEHDSKELTDQYNTLYVQQLKKYDPLVFPADAYKFESLDGAELLGEIITSSSKDPFAIFVKDIGAMEWLKTGVDEYLHHEMNPDGVCPFCQKPLDDKQHKGIAACFDKKYDENMAKLNAYLSSFRDTMGSLYLSLKNLLASPFPAVAQSGLEAQIETLATETQNALNTIREKIANPSGIFTLPDVHSVVKGIETTVSELNQQIGENNELYRLSDEKKNELERKVKEYISFLIDDEYKKYIADKDKCKTTKANLQKEIIEKQKRLGELAKELEEANAEGVPTEDAMTKINELLRHSNFQGFELREEPGKKNVYAVMRLKDGKPDKVVDELSEGERSFIAFLYFYYDVLGFKSDAENKAKRPKVIVIDDPVSSMDDSALYIIGSLVKTLADLCLGRATLKEDKLGDAQIDQMFILTHNVHFHRDITIGKTASDLYEKVSFFLVKKQRGISECIRCVKNVAVGQSQNYNPVKNSYYALWSEYTQLESPVALVNVMHQILEYYFIQLCGYDGESLPDIILKEREEKFFKRLSDGTLDTSEYNLAESMLYRLTSSPSVIAEGHYIEDENDVEIYKDIFERIFRAMDQDQHYDMMVESVHWNES